MILSQRCDFFRVATSGSFSVSHLCTFLPLLHNPLDLVVVAQLTCFRYQESKTRLVKLNDETPEEVDMLLLHLYLLEDPDFEDKQHFKHRYRAAESALKLGDKYNLPHLGKAGQGYMSRSFRFLCNWGGMAEDDKQKWIRRLERLWTRNYSGADIIWEVAVKQLVALAKDIIEYEPFQELCADNTDIALDFMRAQAKMAHESRNRSYLNPVTQMSSAITPGSLASRYGL